MGQEIVHEHPVIALPKNLNSSVKDFEEWGYSANLEIDAMTYLTAFLACWFSRRVFSDSSTTARPETFLMARVMARSKPYTLDVPYMACAYRSPGELHKAYGRVPRTSGRWALVLGLLGSYFYPSYGYFHQDRMSGPFSVVLV